MQTCLYRNSRDRMVILRCIGPQSYFLEKVIFPFETWTFDAPQQADVELWCHGLGGAELLERMNSDQLQLLHGPEAAEQLQTSDVTIDDGVEATAGGRGLKV